jgi:transposase-like protein
MEDAWCYETLRRCRWPDGVTCPRCGLKRVTAHTRSGRTARVRYLCLRCRRTFTDLTGTPLARTNLPLETWFLCLWLFGQERSVVEMARDLGVKWDTAVHMQRRLARGLSSSGFLRQLREIIVKGGGGGSKRDMPRVPLQSRSGPGYGVVRKRNRRWTEGA